MPRPGTGTLFFSIVYIRDGVEASEEHRGRTGAVRLDQHAFRTAANSPINPATDDLGTLPGGTTSWGWAMDAFGQVVGFSDCGPGISCRHAFVYAGGVMYDLNNLIPADSGWELFDGYGINDRGQIVGLGVQGRVPA